MLAQGSRIKCIQLESSFIAKMSSAQQQLACIFSLEVGGSIFILEILLSVIIKKNTIKHNPLCFYDLESEREMSYNNRAVTGPC